MDQISFLHVRGLLTENMVYEPTRGYESPRPGRRAEGNPEYQLVLLDRDDHVLLSVAPEVQARGCNPANAPVHYSVRGVLPLHPAGASYELRRGSLLYRTDIPSHAPVVEATQSARSAIGICVQWRNEENGCGKRRITYSVVAAMESGQRITVARNLTDAAYNLDMTQFPVAGKGILYVVANDGVRSAEAPAGPIEVPARPPTVHILSPSPDARVAYGQPVSVLGCCLSMGGRPCSTEHLLWTLDGKMFAEATLIAALHELAPGSHQLRLVHETDCTERVESLIEFSVEEPDEHSREWEVLMLGVEDYSPSPTKKMDCPPPALY